MFCLECGAEMAVRASACPVCGHIYGERERSLREPRSEQAAHTAPAPAFGTPAGSTPQSAPSLLLYGGDAGATPGQPDSLPGRLVLIASLGLAADLLLPWVSVNGENITPSSIGAPVVVVVALLAAATLPVFTASLRQHSVWSALPLIVGAFCAGIAGSIWLLLAPLTQIVAVPLGIDPSNLTLSPQGGLYLFLIGSAVLLVSGQKMLAVMHEAQLAAARRYATRAPQPKGVAARPAANATTLQNAPQASSPAEVTPAAASTSVEGETPHRASDPKAPVAPVLPGSDAWHQPPAAPSPIRPAPGSGWGKSRAPQRLR